MRGVTVRSVSLTGRRRGRQGAGGGGTVGSRGAERLVGWRCGQSHSPGGGGADRGPAEAGRAIASVTAATTDSGSGSRRQSSPGRGMVPTGHLPQPRRLHPHSRCREARACGAPASQPTLLDLGGEVASDNVSRSRPFSSPPHFRLRRHSRRVRCYCSPVYCTSGGAKT